MAEVILNFPRSFMWGTATASHSVEGNNINNNWYAWEKSGHIIHRQTSGRACDWWGGRWREDFDRAVETGQNAHRLSLEWSRINPNPNRWDEDSLDHYRQMVRGLIERGMTPIVTLHHFSEPLWVSELGGWQDEAILEYFENYARKSVEALREYVSFWCTINEPNILATMAYLKGVHPPGKSSVVAFYKAYINLIKGHAIAYQIIHELQPDAKVGLTHQYRGFQAALTYSPLDIWATNTMTKYFNNLIPYALNSGRFRFFGVHKNLKAARGTQDFFGLNYYSSDHVSFSIREPENLFIRRFYPPEADLSPTNYIANEPYGFFQAIKWAKEYKLPIIITGNGTDDPNDEFRTRYLVKHIHKLWHAVNFNWKILGYFYWSIVDNFEWEYGWSQQFGLWKLNRDTQERRKRVSADLYQAICLENSLSSEMVERYCPKELDKLFPN